MLHAVERAGVAAAEGRAAAGPVLRHLAGRGTRFDMTPRAPVEVDVPMVRIAPNLTGPEGIHPPGDRFILRTARELACPMLVVTQDGRELHRRRLVLRAVPGRPFHRSDRWQGPVDQYGPAVRITVL